MIHHQIDVASSTQDAMAKEIFSIYVCTRWAPNSEFQKMLDNEIATEQLKGKPEKLYQRGRFIPLRCSENFQVFSHTALGETSFENFEQQMKSLAKWYEAEQAQKIWKNIFWILLVHCEI